MPDGVVIIDDQPVGVFSFSPDDELISITLKSGRPIKETLEHASDNGLTVELLATPAIPQE